MKPRVVPFGESALLVELGDEFQENVVNWAAAIAGAPGVSPCRQSVSTASSWNGPSWARTPPSRTKDRACVAATCGSVCSAPASLRERRVPSAS